MNYISILRLSIAFVAFSIFAHAQSVEIFSVETLPDYPTDGLAWGSGIRNNFNGEFSVVHDGDESPPPVYGTTYFGPTFYAGVNRDSYKGNAGVTSLYANGYRIRVNSISPGDPGSPDGSGHNFKAVFMFDAESIGPSEEDGFLFGESDTLAATIAVPNVMHIAASLATYRPMLKADGEYYAGPLFSIDLDGYSDGLFVTNIEIVNAGATAIWTLMPQMESSNNYLQSSPGHPRNLTVDTSENATTLTGFTLRNITQVGFLLETTAEPVEEAYQFGVSRFNAFATIPDSDSDGLSDYDEVNTHSTNPLLADTDSDGLSDGSEVNTYSTNPLDSDSDDDGLTDHEEVQGTSIYRIVSEYLSWHDARDSAIERGGHLAVVSNQHEWNKIYQLISNTSPEGYWLGATDEATEGIWEWVNGEDWSFTNWHLGEPNNDTLSYKPDGENYLSTWASDNHEWNDSDSGLPFSKEYIIEYQINQTDPNNPDSDNDGLSDGSEVTTHQTNPNLSDTDSDQLSDYSEINSHLTDPNDSDSDDDGLEDGAEINTYSSNPISADTSGDGFTDGFLVSEGFSPTTDYNALRTETVNQILDLRVGSTMIEVSDGKADITMTLEETSDLSEWSNAGTSEKTIEVDAPPGTRFFRFKMTE